MKSQDFGLTIEAIKKISAVLEANPKVEKVLIYGSRAKGNYKPGSDIDLTMIGPELTTTDLLKIENDLDDLLLPNRVDLSLYSQIEDPDFLDHIKRVGIVFYQR